MSRIGKLPIEIPSGVTITVEKDNTVIVKGSKGELKKKYFTPSQLSLIFFGYPQYFLIF